MSFLGLAGVAMPACLPACSSGLQVGRPEAPHCCRHHAGSTKSENRRDLWQAGIKRCFFCTPQTFSRDVKNGACAARRHGSCAGMRASHLQMLICSSAHLLIWRCTAITPLQASAPSRRWCASWWMSATEPPVRAAKHLRLAAASQHMPHMVCVPGRAPKQMCPRPAPHRRQPGDCAGNRDHARGRLQVQSAGAQRHPRLRRRQSAGRARGGGEGARARSEAGEWVMGSCGLVQWRCIGKGRGLTSHGYRSPGCLPL